MYSVPKMCNMYSNFIELLALYIYSNQTFEIKILNEYLKGIFLFCVIFACLLTISTKVLL